MIDYSLGVKLDAICEEDLEQMRIWRNERSVNKWCRQTGLITPPSQKEWFMRQNADPTINMFLIRKPIGTAIGVCGLTSIDLFNRRAEFSLYIGKEFQGQGYGSKALKTLLKYGFNDLGLNGIWGESFDGNPAIEMFYKIGMRKEGIRRQFYYKDGEFLDAILFSMMHGEYLEAKWNTL